MESGYREQMGMLLELVRAELRRLRSSNAMPESCVAEMVKAVPTSLVRDIVNDARRSNDVGWLKPPEGPAVQRGTGWVTPPGLSDSVPGLKYIDQMIDVQDLVDKKELEGKFKRRI
jgi:hypothetical protein